MFDTSDDGNAGPTLSSNEAARRLSVTPTTIRRWASEGTLKALRVGIRYRIPAEAVERMIRPAHVDEETP